MTEIPDIMPGRVSLPGIIRGGGHVLIDLVPHAQAIGMKIVSVARAEATVSVPFDERFIGDPETRVIHGGLVTTMLDNVSGVAAFLSFDTPQSIATLDIRIDYNRPARPDMDIFASATCYKVTRSVAFVRGVAYETDREDPIATSVATFMIGANQSSAPGAKE